mgnify:FL=1
MSADEFYLKGGYTPKTQYQSWVDLSTLAIWTPTTSTRVVLTGIAISNNALAGTMLITFGNLDGTKIGEFSVGASLTIMPFVGAVESTMYDRSIFGRPSTSSSTGGWRVTAFGFELE